MNLSASQHAKTPQKRKRLFVNVRPHPKGLKQKGGSLVPRNYRELWGGGS